MNPLLILLGIGTALQVVGTVSSVRSQNRAYKAQVEAQEAEQQQQEVTNLYQRRQAIRQAQIARADALSGAYGSGAGGSSGSMGGIGSLGSQLGSILGTGSQLTSLSRDIFSANQRAGMFENRARFAGQVAQFGSQLSSYAVGQGATYGQLFNSTILRPSYPTGNYNFNPGYNLYGSSAYPQNIG